MITIKKNKEKGIKEATISIKKKMQEGLKEAMKEKYCKCNIQVFIES